MSRACAIRVNPTGHNARAQLVRSTGAYGADLVQIDANAAHAARVYDYLLGGTDNFAADRHAAEQHGRALGGLDIARAGARANRAFLARTVHYLATTQGIRQFLDIGTGIPRPDNVHTLAQQALPDTRIVSVDNDPLVLAHAHTLERSTHEGAAAFVLGDLRDADDIVRRAATTLDLDEPVAVVLVAVLDLMPDEHDPYTLVDRLVRAIPSESHMVISHMIKDVDTTAMTELERSVPPSARYRFTMRTHAEVSRFFNGLEMTEPGLVTVDRWHPQRCPTELHTAAHHYGGIGRKS